MTTYSISYTAYNGYEGSVIVADPSYQIALINAIGLMNGGSELKITSVARLSDNKLIYSTNPASFTEGLTMDANIIVNAISQQDGYSYVRFENGQNSGDIIDFNPEGHFHPDIQWIKIPSALKIWITNDYIVQGDKIVPPSFEYLKKQLSDISKNIRKSFIDVALVGYRNHKFPVDEQSFNRINAKLIYIQSAKLEKTWSEQWKSENGYIDFKYTDLIELNKLMNEHIAELFKKESSFLKQFESKNISDFEQIVADIDGYIQNIWGPK